MKRDIKRLLPVLFLWFSVPALAQTWETVKIDSVVSVILPKGHTSNDTLGQKVYSAQTLFGNIQVVITPDNPRQMPDIEKKKHLLKYYDNYLNKVQKSAKGTVSKERDTLLGDLHVKDFTLTLQGSAGEEIRKFRILHENCATYTFQFFYNALQKEVSEGESNKFFNAIKVANDPAASSQFTSAPATPADVRPNNKLIICSIGGAVLLAVVIWLAMRKRKR
ncbi:hypothetical protein [Hufsiella ginkgonis]|uniref:Uncharacterized protein n=1 Tax=Hufsiella ginkgonis TaxID=2695274 RepID=A0A7K1Y3W0_9SPHI|nr:hypothetical protein [Hufsiella ginkgonis]MXV17798.1 hypothetical protein [Hufsiella ginkgonis]